MNPKTMLKFYRTFFPLIYIGFLIPFIVFLFTQRQNEQQTIIYPNTCNFSSNLYRGSTKRDVILFSADKFHPGLELAVRSLRSTGSQCRVIILAAKKIQINSKIQALFNELDVEIKDDCLNLHPERNYVPHMLRYEFEQQWLSENLDRVDRVFHADAFDVYFQKDPFGPEISTDRLLFVVEPHAFRSCGWNLNWMKTCYGETMMNKMRNRYIICSGSIIGGVKPYLQLLDLMISQDEWTSCWKPSYDQPILNYLVWENILDEQNIKYDLTGCNGNYLTMQWCLPTDSIRLNKQVQIMSEIGTVPAFFHQYNRNKPLESFLREKCKVFK
ncbi:hypothetical protein TVAG_347090 [Trichomonas vaginalis G3]|uniref:Uncharacterized protein n=1 Tax=Trichomonas vaginalis (strain ATCC PRA-98 / G3) TaxID=412133 RepID=A2G6E1_TRIV3|nr:nucleotide-diphospho-sugar transferases family [Trichomonas vaginalis G3]EAX87278.1 hypothetical protein TVAG_347090 [Trichomonas vaginalis G3]KAI5482243.1 nucleotide-diphospho-sugar transferases family [Trichomonas vaginalis G3]|eukprot:XP_001300208.1 hypothetical protein [Trichomonas vaginalis G3]